jgi:hypothetical protein
MPMNQESLVRTSDSLVEALQISNMPLRNADVWGAVGNAAKISSALVWLNQANLQRHTRSVKDWRNLKNRKSPYPVAFKFVD